MFQRNILKTLLCIGIFSFSGVSNTYSQSYYSQAEIGVVHHFVSGQSIGMGGVGLAVADPVSVNFLNPAALTNLSVTYLSGNFLHQNTSLTGSSVDAAISSTNVDGVQFHVPLKPRRISTAIGLIPYSTVEYTFEGEGAISGTTYRQVVSGDGGINTAFLSIAIRPFDRVSVGVSGLYYFGALRKLWRVVFADQVNFRNTRNEVSEIVSAGNIRLGVQVRLLSKWRIAAVITPGITFDADKTVILENVQEFSDFSDRSVKLPLAYGFGTSFFIGSKLLVAADYYAEHWSGSSGTGYVNDSKRLGLGIEFSARGTGFNSSYFSRMSFRAGVTYRDLGLEKPVGERVTELFGTVGLGVPIKWSAARLDLGFEAGQRGALPENPIRERFVRLAVSITAGERWFYRGGPR